MRNVWSRQQCEYENKFLAVCICKLPVTKVSECFVSAMHELFCERSVRPALKIISLIFSSRSLSDLSPGGPCRYKGFYSSGSTVCARVGEGNLPGWFWTIPQTLRWEHVWEMAHCQLMINGFQTQVLRASLPLYLILIKRLSCELFCWIIG